MATETEGPRDGRVVVLAPAWNPVLADPRQALEAALKRLGKQLERAGFMAAIRRHAFARSRGERRRDKHRLALARRARVEHRRLRMEGE